MRRAAMSVLGVVAAAGLLAGCTASQPATTPAATVTVTAATPSTATTPSTGGTPSTPAGTPSAPPSGTSGAPSPVSSQQGGGKGCSPNDVAVPDGADTATIGDVDETDSDATEFFSESPRFEFGVRTRSGATVILPDALAGPATHSGWMARLDLAIVAVIDDDRGATLHAFVDCRFVEPKGVDGQPYRFTLNGFGTVGTGVACRADRDGTRQLVGLNAVRLSTGRYRIDATEVRVSADGRTAVNGATTRGATSYSQGSAQVRAANASTCGDVPIVHTSGR